MSAIIGIASAQSVVINEIMAANTQALADEDGDFPDWIELFNAGVEPVNLVGYGISDNAATPFKWSFGEVILQPGAYLILFASGKNRLGPPMHTNFRIKSGGESVYLTDPGGNLVDYSPSKAIPPDHSLGRQPDATGEWVYFATATPGAANTTTGFLGITAPPIFSHAPGFHAEPFELQIQTADVEATVYYTLDGSLPTPQNLQGSAYAIKNIYPHGELIFRTNWTHEYAEPISISTPEPTPEDLALITLDVCHYPDTPFVPPQSPFKGMIVRATAVKPGFLPSEVRSASFMIHTNLHARYSLPIVSLIADPRDLFDYETGIFVPGKRFSDWMTANPEKPLQWTVSANYHQRGRAWERSAQLEFFEPDGTLAVDQTIGVRVQGNSTRALPRKPLRLYARDAYGADKINHELFPGLQAHGEASRGMDEFQRVLLRSEHDQSYSYFYRDAFVQRLVAHLGFDVQAYRPVIQFLNGEYWGIMSMQERYDEYYVANHYGVDPDDVVLLDNTIFAIVKAGQPNDNASYLALRSYATTNDLSLAVHYSYMQTQMDITNFVNHHVAYIYINAFDWGTNGNNTAIWRKRTADFAPDAPPGQDGRWRWMMFDAGTSFMYPDANTLARNMGVGPGVVLFTRLLENSDFRNLVINTFADQMNSTFRPARVQQIAESVYQELLPELSEHNGRWAGNIGAPSKTYAEQRPNFMRQHLMAAFNLAGTATLTLAVSHTNQGRIQINSLMVDESTVGLEGPSYPWTGIYFVGVPIHLVALPNPGCRFVGWTDGEASADRTVVLTEDHLFTAIFEPEVHRLMDGDYQFSYWDPLQAAGTQPPSMVFYQTTVRDPGLLVEMDSVWTLPYNLDSRSRINGLGDDGFAFLNTSNPQNTPGAGYVGAAVLSLNTHGRRQVDVTWTGGTVTPNLRVYGLRLQYRLGSEGPFSDVLDANGNPVEYLRHSVAGHQQVIGPMRLPASLDDQPRVELRWKYYYVSGASGARAQLQVANIRVTSTPIQACSLQFTGVPLSAQTGRVLPPITVEARLPNGSLAAEYNGLIQIIPTTTPNALSGTLVKPAVGGVAVFTNLVFQVYGNHTLSANAVGLSAGVSDVITVLQVTDILVPRYLQGSAPLDEARLPFAYRLRVSGLRPGATYRYANQVINSHEDMGQAGAGNMVFVKTDGGAFVRNTGSPDFQAEALGLGHGELVANNDGEYEGWFITESSEHSCFTPGNTVRMQLLLNNGRAGDAAFHFLTTPLDSGGH